jgi:hypothetical protein
MGHTRIVEQTAQDRNGAVDGLLTSNARSGSPY